MKVFWVFLPEPSGRVQSTSEGSSGGLRGQVGGQRWDGLGIVTRIICKLDSNRFCGALRDGAVQLLNSLFGFYPLIETDETNTFGEPFGTKIKNIT